MGKCHVQNCVQIWGQIRKRHDGKWLCLSHFLGVYAPFPDFRPGRSLPDPFLITIRDGFASKMTPAQIAKAEKLAREWKPK
jgi:hypothetical protein